MDFKVQVIDRHRLYTDGKGVTTLVGLYGCPLRCEYCINKRILEKPVWKECSKEALLQEVMQDYCYFVATNGGITFGGGEPLLQAEAIEEFISILPNYVNVTLETSLCAEMEKVAMLLDKAALFIVDVKTMNSEIYQRYTHHSNKQVIENLKYIVNNCQQKKCKIRIPRIPNYTTEEDVRYTEVKIREMGFECIEIFDYKIKGTPQVG